MGLLLSLRTDAAAADAPVSTKKEEATESPHLALLGEVVQAVDNMHDLLSAYRQHQVRGKGREGG